MARKPNREAHPPTAEGLKYGFRRLAYNAHVAAGVYALLQIPVKDEREFAEREGAKIAGLMMARNFDDFFFVLPKRKDKELKIDDLHVEDYGLTWNPDIAAKLDEKGLSVKSAD